jgi:hypothetical protein
MKVALVHDWLTGMRGGEKVLEVLCELFPSADLFTLFHFRGSVSPLIERHHIETSFLQRLPFAERHYRRFLPLFPRAIESFRIDGYDLVVSSSHCVAKSVKVPVDVPHVCYCHSPMRYAWDQFDAYFGPERVGALKSRLLYRPILTGWQGGMREQRRGCGASWPTPATLRGGSGDTIIALPRSCIPPSTRTFSRPAPRRRSPISSLCQPWFPTSGSISRSMPAPVPGNPFASLATGRTATASRPGRRRS